MKAEKMNHAQRGLPLSIAFAGSMIGYGVTSGSILSSIIPFFLSLVFGVLLIWSLYSDTIQGLLQSMEKYPRKDTQSDATD